MKQREIKFRAWDKKLKEMFFFSGWHFNSEYCCLVLPVQNHPEYGYGDLPCESEDSMLMQYTGLKDKNGKEIYEWDIVEWHPDYDKEKGGKAVIVWDEDQWVPSVENTGGDGYYGYEGREFGWDELEIIGNIYQNPELLK